MNRRGILGLIAGAPVAGAAVAQQFVGDAFGGGVAPSGAYGLSQASGTPMPPRMERASAMRAILGDARAVAEIEAELYEENRVITTVDPDIMIMRSWSPMAKITFQRQRNVERAMAELSDTAWDRPQRYVQAIDRRLQKMMWGT